MWIERGNRARHTIVQPRGVPDSQNPTVPTPAMVERFEPQLRSKEWVERLFAVRVAYVLFVLYHATIVGACLWRSSSRSALAWKLATLLGCVVYTDFLTGLLHIYLDHRRCDLGDPIDMAAYAFRYDHHAYPNNFFKFSSFFPSGSANIASSVTGPATLVFHIGLWYVGALYHTVLVDSALEHVLVFLMAFVACGTLCQTTHALAHEGLQMRNSTLPKTVATLQRCGIILSPKAHSVHHKQEHDLNFCILNGWANPLLNTIAPAIFCAMRQAPGHFQSTAVPGLHRRATRRQ